MTELYKTFKINYLQKNVFSLIQQILTPFFALTFENVSDAAFQFENLNERAFIFQRTLCASEDFAFQFETKKSVVFLKEHLLRAVPLSILKVLQSFEALIFYSL